MDIISYTKKGVPFIAFGGGYSYHNLCSILDDLKIFKKRRQVITQLGDTKICSMCPSKKYGLFDFPTFVKESLPWLKKSFPIDYYTLDIMAGRQQLKIFGEELEINKESFRKVFYVRSSSNGRHPLLMGVGYYRLLCSNGLIASVGEELFNVRTRHYKTTINSFLEDFKERIPLIEPAFEQQKKVFLQLADETIDLKVLVRGLCKGTKQEPQKLVIENLKKMGKSFQYSSSDKVDASTLSTREKEVLYNPIKSLYEADAPKITLNKFKVYNNYTEIFRNRDTAIIEKENRRILNVLMN
ncbi:MAG: DUF932 domain-containing protein [Bacteroidetes bacterium]|nr:DUF932 domain-containing protein [Bacteroidota bacterium]